MSLEILDQNNFKFKPHVDVYSRPTPKAVLSIAFLAVCIWQCLNVGKNLPKEEEFKYTSINLGS